MAKNVADVAAESGRRSTNGSHRAKGLKFERYFTPPGSHAHDLVEWERRTAAIIGEGGKTVFEQKDVEVPRSWSQLAINVVAQKYFRGQQGTPERETSVRDMVDRVVGTLGAWGRQGGYYATEEDAHTWEEELRFLLVTQHASFNSPVWFNLGVPGRKPQAAACFINSVTDSMESILELAKTEGMLFKFGSGTGTNLSVLRSSREQLSGGGTASGPVSFMRGYDSFAGSIKSGGTTRRAAKMVILNADHPDVVDFISCKAEEERKAHSLIDAGYDAGFNIPGGAYDSVQFQNANHSVRATDEFMQAVLEDKDWVTRAVVDQRPMDTYKARWMMREISSAAWVCGDPGVQFDTTIQAWNCVPNTGRINATNPCAEFVFVDDTACNLLSLNLLKFQAEDGSFDVERYRKAIDVCFTGQEIIVSNASYPTPAIAKNSEALRPLGLGYANLGALLMSMGLAYDSDEGRRYAGAITAILTGEAYSQSARMAEVKGPFSEYAKNREPMLRVMKNHRQVAADLPADGEPGLLVEAARAVWDEAVALGEKHGYRNAQATVLAPTGCLVGDSLVMTDRGLVRLRNLGDTEGDKWQPLEANVQTDQGPRPATRFYVNGGEPVVTIETSRGYRIQGTVTHRIKVVDAAGRWTWRRLGDVRPDDQVPLMLGGMFGEPNAKALSLELAEQIGQTIGGSEGWPQVPDSVLSSNDPAVYDAFMRGVYKGCGEEAGGQVFFKTASESFSRDLQALLLALGFVSTRTFDETGGRWSVAMAATRELAAHYDQIPLSREMVDRLVPSNQRLREALMASISERGAVSRQAASVLLEKTGSLELKQVLSFFYDSVASAQLGAEQFTYDLSVPDNVTYVANGFVSHNTIGLMMDCDTTGIEPDLALVKYKKLVGGGLLKIVNNTVPAALRKLGYPEEKVVEIVDYIDQNETIEGAAHLEDEHLKVFDCAFKPLKGLRSIAPMGHVRMMAAVQPFISGSQSKTVNLPTEATVEDIENVYIESWKLGLKCIAIYRDGCKRSQPLSTSRDKEKVKGGEAVAEIVAGPVRRRLPDERRSITHKFDMGGHEGYVTVGLYEDGTPGEIFITMAKEGSTVSGLMDAFATQTSLALQYGVPLASMVNKFSHMRFEPSGFTRNPEIPMAKSLVDYLFRWLASKFLSLEDQAAVGIIKRDVEPPPAPAPASNARPISEALKEPEEIKLVLRNPASSDAKVTFVLDRDAPACADCGAITVRSGACYKCMNCGASTGCS